MEKLIRQGLVGLNFYGTMEKPKGPIQADFSTRSPCTWDRVSAGIIYWKGLAFVVLPAWNLQSDFSIAASQIHEALRHIQQTYAPIAHVNPSNHDLEDLTYLVMHEAPNLDKHSFMQGLTTSEGLAEVQKLAMKLCNSSRLTTNDEPEKMLEVNNDLNQFCNGSAISVSSDPDEAHRQIQLILEKVNYLRALMMQGTASRKVADRIGQQLHEISLCLTRESFEGRTNEIIDATMKVNLVELNPFLKVLQDEKGLDAASIKRMFFEFIAQIGL